MFSKSTVWVRKYYPSEVFCNFFPNGRAFVSKILHAYCVLKSMANYNILFNYLDDTVMQLSATSSHGLWVAGLAEGQLYLVHHKGWMATKFTTWLSCAMLRAFHRLHSKPETIPELKKCTAADLGWLAADSDQRSYQRMSQTSEYMHLGRWWTFWTDEMNLIQKYFDWTQKL